MNFHWWQPVYYAVHSPTKSYPSRTPEKTGRWVGVANHQGDALTYLILTDDTKQVIPRSAVRSATDPHSRNLRADNDRSDGGEVVVQEVPVILSTTDLREQDLSPSELRLPSFTPAELLNQTFIRENDAGQKLRAKVIRQVQEMDDDNHRKIKFLVELGDGEIDKLIDYNVLSDIIERQRVAEEDESEKLWAVNRIIGHQGPLTQNDHRYKGSQYNVLIEWEDFSNTYEPMSAVATDDPITLTKYAIDNDLLDKPGWKHLKRFARREKKFQRMLNQAKRANDRNAPIFMFGVQVPRGAKQAFALDQRNGNDLWERAMKTEIQQLEEYETFRDMGKGIVELAKDFQ
jgi:hypothetical protein